jgi:hypothetical protein
MSTTGGFPDEAEHPILLPWYAAGTLDEWTARRIEEHLEGCPDCRLEHEELGSMRRTLERRPGEGHVAVLDLIAFATDVTPAAGAEARAAARRHLEDCASCREEIEFVREARRSGEVEAGSDEQEESPGRGARPVAGSRWRLAFFAAAAAALVLLVPATRALVDQGDAGLQSVHPVRLMAQTRGDEDQPRLSGSGPWLIEVVLPFGAPAGEYAVRIRPPAGTGRADEIRAQPNAEGILSLLLPDLPRPGSYEISVTPRVPNGTSYRYSFARSPP